MCFLLLCRDRVETNQINMTILINQETNEATIYHVRADLSKLFKVSDRTLLSWSKQGFKQIDKYFIYFNPEEVRGRTKRRKSNY